MLTEVVRIPMYSFEYTNEFLEKHQDMITSLVKGYNFTNVGLISKHCSSFRAEWHFNGFDTDRQISTMIRVVYDYSRKILLIDTLDNVNGARAVNRVDEIYGVEL